MELLAICKIVDTSYVKLKRLSDLLELVCKEQITIGGELNNHYHAKLSILVIILFLKDSRQRKS